VPALLPFSITRRGGPELDLGSSIRSQHMANTLNNPTQGFQVFGRMEGASPTAGLTPVWIASTDASLIFRGDPVYPSTTGGTNLSGRYITSVQVASFAQPLAGVFMGLEQYQPSVGRVVWSNFYNGAVTGSTGDIKAYIIDDPTFSSWCRARPARDHSHP
jgi:hypothetical protein